MLLLRRNVVIDDHTTGFYVVETDPSPISLMFFLNANGNTSIWGIQWDTDQIETYMETLGIEDPNPSVLEGYFVEGLRDTSAIVMVKEPMGVQVGLNFPKIKVFGKVDLLCMQNTLALPVYALLERTWTISLVVQTNTTEEDPIRLEEPFQFGNPDYYKWLEKQEEKQKRRLYQPGGVQIFPKVKYAGRRIVGMKRKLEE
jgi:hypothetical protein